MSVPDTAATLLAFDTSTETLLVALQRGEQAWTYQGAGGAQASAGLLPVLRGLLEQARLRLEDLDAIAFGRGPGAFTGLRTACSVAQGLALGSGRPVLPVDTLMVVADAAGLREDDRRDLWAVMDARMHEVYAACYRRDAAGHWQQHVAPALYDPQALAVADTAAVAGNARAVYAARWPAELQARWIDAAPQPEALLRVARQAWVQGLAVDAAQALPLYVRDKVAFTTAEREARRAAAPAGAPT